MPFEAPIERNHRGGGINLPQYSVNKVSCSLAWLESKGHEALEWLVKACDISLDLIQGERC